jgi:surface protein
MLLKYIIIIVNFFNIIFFYFSKKKIIVIDKFDLRYLIIDKYLTNNTEHIYEYSHITDFTDLFKYSEITTIPLLDTSNVTNMSFMFDGCSSLTSIPLLDTSNVTTMYRMFSGCSSLTSIPLLNTSNITDMGCIFWNCYQLNNIPLLDTVNVTNIPYMFYGCSSLPKIEQVKFFYQKDKLLLKSLETNPKLFSEQKLNELLGKYN